MSSMNATDSSIFNPESGISTSTFNPIIISLACVLVLIACVIANCRSIRHFITRKQVKRNNPICDALNTEIPLQMMRPVSNDPVSNDQTTTVFIMSVTAQDSTLTSERSETSERSSTIKHTSSMQQQRLPLQKTPSTTKEMDGPPVPQGYLPSSFSTLSSFSSSPCSCYVLSDHQNPSASSMGVPSQFNGHYLEVACNKLHKY
ncbi:hypothetical protein BDF14DRAFT_1993586 [Spinellus fusiger]|nr:hypothetical protein BDF14DRAFT_1993586 [Spinellus fusiger]